LAYVGNSPALKYASFAVQHFTTSATTTYTLDHAVANENDIRLVINNVIQQPGSGKAYTASATTLTLSAATAGTDTMYCVFLGKAVQTVVPPAGSVTGSTLADDVISAQSALGAAPADTDEFLVSDSGTLKRVDYSYLKSTVVNRPNAQPIIINGDCSVSQRTTSTTGVTSTTYGAVDRIQLVNNSMGTYTVAQESLTSGAAYEAGFHNAWRIDCTTADSSPAAGDVLYPRYKIESQDLSIFRKGTSSAQSFTIAFWVKSNKTGNAQVNFYDIDNTRLCAGTYSISSANTWEHKVINIAADTTGAWADDNGEGLRIEWRLDSGSDSTSGTTPTAWEAQNAADRDVAGQLQIARHTDNDWAITGIQLEVGEYTSSTLPPFQHESYADNLLRCQRYFQNIADGTDKAIGMGQYWEAQEFIGHRVLSTVMRTTPTLEYVTSTGYYAVLRDGGADALDALTISSSPSSSSMISWYVASAQGLASNTKNRPGFFRTQNSSSKVGFTAEL